jgi:plasmid stabilization system protein ParE
MDDAPLVTALDRAERALQRIERALANRQQEPQTVGRDEELRAKVREVVEELDELIREAAA